MYGFSQLQPTEIAPSAPGYPPDFRVVHHSCRATEKIIHLRATGAGISVFAVLLLFHSQPARADTVASAAATDAGYLASADLALTQTAAPDPVAPGSNVTYTLYLANRGPAKTGSVTVRDDLPAATTYVSCSSTARGVCGGSGNSRTVSFSSLAAGASATITLVAQVKTATAPGATIVNTASVASARTTDPNPANNSATATVTVQPQADLSVAKSASPDPVRTGAEITYTIRASNGGPQSAASVTLTDTLPPQTSFRSCSVTSGGTCEGSGNERTVSFSGIGAGSSASVTLVALVNPEVADRTTIVNTARLRSDTPDADLSNNSATAIATAVRPAADLSVSQSGSPDPVPRGSNVTYTIQVVNHGPDDATSVTVTDELPASTTFVSCEATAGGSCGGSGSVRTVSFASLPAGGSATMTMTATVSPSVAEGTDLTSAAGVGASAPADPDPSDDSAATTVTAGPELRDNLFRYYMRLQIGAGSYPENLERFRGRPVELVFANPASVEQGGAVDQVLAKNDPPVWKVLYYDFEYRGYTGYSHWTASWTNAAGDTVSAPLSWGVDPLPDHPEWFHRYGGLDRAYWMRENSVQGADKGLPFTLDPAQAGLRTWQTSWLSEKARYHGAHGIYLDEAGPSTLEKVSDWGNQALGPYEGSRDRTYVEAAETYKDDFPGANAQLLTEIRSGLDPGHDFMIWNVTGSGPATTSVVRPRGGTKTFEDWVKQDYVKIGSGAQMDGFAWNRASGAFSESALLWQLRMARYFIERKKYILLKAPGKEMNPDPDPANDAADDPQVTEAWTYSLACYALVADGMYAMFWGAHDLERYWSSTLTGLRLGQGADAGRADGDITRYYRLPGESDNRDGRDYGVLNRAFTNGLVLVNSGTTSRLVTLPLDGAVPRYKTVEGVPVASLTLGPNRGSFLLLDSR